MINIIKKNKDLFPFILIVFFAVVLSVNKGFSHFTLDGIKMYFALIFPALFPYLFLTTLLSFNKGCQRLSKFLSPVTTKLFKVNGLVGYAYFMSLLSGYPIGASIISDLKKSNLISQKEAERGSILCSTCSPSYMISTVGSVMFNSVKFGLNLYIIQIVSSFIVSILFSRFYKDGPSPYLEINSKKSQNVIYDSITSAITSTLFVGAIITLFYVFTEVLYSLGFFALPIYILNLIFKDNRISLAIIYSLFENGKGMKTLSLLGASKQTFLLASFLCGFSGISIILQSILFLKSAKIKIAPFLLSKVTVAIICFIFSLLFSLWLF